MNSIKVTGNIVGENSNKCRLHTLSNNRKSCTLSSCGRQLILQTSVYKSSKNLAASKF